MKEKKEEDRPKDETDSEGGEMPNLQKEEGEEKEEKVETEKKDEQMK